MSRSPRARINWARVRTVARTDLKQLVVSKDFWIPMGILGAFCRVRPQSIVQHFPN